MLLILIAIYFKARGEFLQQIFLIFLLFHKTTKSTQKSVFYIFQQTFQFNLIIKKLFLLLFEKIMKQKFNWFLFQVQHKHS